MSEQQLPLIEIAPDKSIPPKAVKRNSYGLIENFPYIYSEDGSINWKMVVDQKFLYLNPEMKRRSKIETKYNKKFEEIKIIEDKVDDSDLVISLGGIKQLLKIRGYTSVHPSIITANNDYVGVSCAIYFIPNFETEGREIRYADNACATPENTNGFGQKYLLEIATNRAFCRCIRNFLNINIVSQDELGGLPIESSEKPVDNTAIILNKLMIEHGVTWEKIHEKLLKEKFPKAETYKNINDVPAFKRHELSSRIQTKAEEKALEKTVEKK